MGSSPSSGSRSLNRLAAFLVISATVLTAGCGGDERRCRPDDAPLIAATPTTSVARVLRAESPDTVRVRGPLHVRRGGPVRLCTRLVGRRPPRCAGPSVVVEGIGNPYRVVNGIERLDTGRGEPAAGWARSVTIAGRLDGSTLRVSIACATQDVADHVRESDGPAVFLDLALSSAATEHLNLEGHRDPSRVQAAQSRWGRFDILVFPGRDERALDEAIGQAESFIAGGLAAVPPPDREGVTWLRVRGIGWTALTEYRGNVVLEWFAGRTKRTDERWRRLHEILGELD